MPKRGKPAGMSGKSSNARSAQRPPSRAANAARYRQGGKPQRLVLPGGAAVPADWERPRPPAAADETWVYMWSKLDPAGKYTALTAIVLAACYWIACVSDSPGAQPTTTR